MFNRTSEQFIINASYARARAHTCPHTPTQGDLLVQADPVGHSRHSSSSWRTGGHPCSRGGGYPCSRGPRGCETSWDAHHLIVLRTQRISRSLSLIPQRIPASLAVVSAAAGPAPHSHPARVCSVLHPLSHAGQGILSESLAVGRGVASARSTDAGRRRRPARWTRLSASNRLRSRSSHRPS